MDFIDLVNSKDRDCESKKKISFSQRSPIETKKAIGVKDFDNLGHSFNINNGEVIESALFDRIKRDCGGELISVTPIRRFRKVGSDEWFSVDAAIGNDSWIIDFDPSNDDEAIEQGQTNTLSQGGGSTSGSDNGRNEGGAVFEHATKFNKVNPIEKAKKIQARKNTVTTIIIMSSVAFVAFTAYKLYKKRKNG